MTCPSNLFGEEGFSLDQANAVVLVSLESPERLKVERQFGARYVVDRGAVCVP